MDDFKIASDTRECLGGRMVVISSISGRMDGGSVARAESHLVGHLRGGVRYLVLDCHDLTYMNSTAAALLVKCNDEFEAAGGSFQLVRLPAPVLALLDVLGLDCVLRIAKNVDEALANLA